MTVMPAGKPKNSGDSNDSMPRIRLSTNDDTIAGAIRIRVMRRNVCQRDAPHIRLDSSKVGSIARKASTMNRKRNGVEYCIMCQTTPPYEYTLIGDGVAPVSHFQTRLSTPTCGLPSMPQAIAVRIGGMKNGRVTSTSRVPRAGVSVRARMNASATARRIDGIVLAKEMPTVLASTRKLLVVKICA